MTRLQNDLLKIQLYFLVVATQLALSRFAWLIMHVLDMAPGLIFAGKPLDVAEIRVSVAF